MHELFSSHEGVECWTRRDVQNNRVPEISTKIILLTAANGAIRNANVEIHSDDIKFDLRSVVSVSQFDGWLSGRENKFWNGTILGRHNNSLNVWSQKRSENYSVQSVNGFDSIPDGEIIVCAVYVRESQPDVQSRRNDFLKYMGGEENEV